MKVTAMVYSVEKHSFFTVLMNGKKEYFYMQKNLVKKFIKYLSKGKKVIFEVEDKKYKLKNIFSYKVLYFYSIETNKKYEIHSFYDLQTIRDGIVNLINGMNNILFIDYEMNMQEYYSIPNFYPEIIEAGYYLCNKDLEIIKSNHLYIKPTQAKKVTKRTINFLKYDHETLSKARDYHLFYNEIVEIQNKYAPAFIVWGKSDISSMRQSFIINKVEPINFQFIDLLQLHINYNNLKESPGLFKMWEAYNGRELPKQKHDALEDALVTKEVFYAFKKQIT